MVVEHQKFTANHTHKTQINEFSTFYVQDAKSLDSLKLFL